jgi:hypothetical protein
LFESRLVTPAGSTLTVVRATLSLLLRARVLAAARVSTSVAT